MAKISRFFEDIALTAASGLEIQNIINGIKNLHTGEVDQIVIAVTAGSPTAIDVEIRYEIGVSDRAKLVYLNSAGTITGNLFVDAGINAVFSLKDKDNTDGDLHLFMQPDADCTVDIRVDMNIDNRSGL